MWNAVYFFCTKMLQCVDKNQFHLHAGMKFVFLSVGGLLKKKNK